MTFDQLLQQYVNYSYGELVAIAREGLNGSVPSIRRYFGNDDAASSFLMVLVGSCLGVDGELSVREATFINEVMETNMDVDWLIASATACSDEESFQLVDDVIDALDTDAKLALSSFCISVMAVDETISRSEVRYISKLLS